MKTKSVSTVLHLVRQETLGELLLGFETKDLNEIAVAYGVKPRRNRLTTVAHLILKRYELHGNIRISIDSPKNQRRKTAARTVPKVSVFGRHIDAPFL